MRKLVMEIKCKNYPHYYNQIPYQGTVHRCERLCVPRVENNADKFVRRPDASENASGLLGFANKVKTKVVQPVREYIHNYKKNIKHTYEHKLIYALIEKELYGRNTLDALTHDSDKMVMYLLGFPKSFVTKYHRKHSEHHVESGKKMNLTSMLCDNIASSPEFKPEKKYSLREYYKKSPELQAVRGFKKLLEHYNFGENIDFQKIKALKDSQYKGMKGVSLAVAKCVSFILLLK